jgi:hypothetical protein
MIEKQTTSVGNAENISLFRQLGGHPGALGGLYRLMGKSRRDQWAQNRFCYRTPDRCRLAVLQRLIVA